MSNTSNIKMLTIGDVYWLNEYEGIAHPQVIVTINDETVEVASLTTNMKKIAMPGNVVLDVGEGNLEKQSIVEVSKTMHINKNQLKEYIGTLSEKRTAEILNGIGFIQRSYLDSRE